MARPPKIYDTAFAERLKMALWHMGGDLLLKPAHAGRFLAKTRQVVHQWFNGTIPATEELWNLEDRLECTARWLVTGDNPPAWSSKLDPTKFRDSFEDDAQPRRTGSQREPTNGRNKKAKRSE